MTHSSNPLSLVTGGARGIGKATVLRLLNQGHRVIALDQSDANLKQCRDELQSDCLITQVFDLRNWQTIGALCDELIQQHGPVKYLVNNAGVWPGGSITELTDDQWQLNLDVNLSAPFALIRALVPSMKSIGGGAIVNVSSRNAFRSSTNNSAYDASKAGLLALTRTTSGELAKYNIRVNAVCPGVIATPGDAATIDDQLFKAAYTKQIPMNRYGEADEIASVIEFLLGPGSSYLTGQAIIVDGGQIACQDNQRFMEIPGLKIDPAKS
jgi:NAD(P)-dependent dehydrogenase (short-subunit alcohol dehydrogenase family)